MKVRAGGPLARASSRSRRVALWLLGFWGLSLGCTTACKKAEPPAGAETELAQAAEVEHDAELLEQDPAVLAEEELGFPDAGPLAPEHSVSQEKLLDAARALDTWAQKGKGHARVALFDLASSTWLLEWNADEAENPASTQKLLTAAAALELLGPTSSFRTEVLGQLKQGRAERLVIRGGGAPDLTTADLWRLARVLVQSGLEEVGSLEVDQSRFDERFVPPAFEQQPHEWAAFRAPVSALAVERNTVTLHVLPTQAGAAARVWLEPPGAVVSQGTVQTGKKGSGDRVTWNLSAGEQPFHLVSEVGGSLEEGVGRRRYPRRLEDPRLVPGFAFHHILKEQGVKVGGTVQLAEAGSLPRLVHLDSAPLSQLVRALGKESDNFTAEMLLIALSQKDGEKGAWSTERGLQVLRNWLEKRGLLTPEIQLKNGSGLFDANRLTPRLLTRVLTAMHERPELYADFLAHLAQGGRDGTLRNRFAQGKWSARVRAKTGTLRDVTALSGYLLRPAGQAPLAFTILLTGTSGRQAAARQKIDQMIERWGSLVLSVEK